MQERNPRDHRNIWPPFSQEVHFPQARILQEKHEREVRIQRLKEVLNMWREGMLITHRALTKTVELHNKLGNE